MTHLTASHEFRSTVRHTAASGCTMLRRTGVSLVEADVSVSRKKKGNSTRVSVTIDAEDLALLQQMAEERDRSVSWMAGRAIRFYLTEMRRGSQLALNFEREADGQ